jgi:hypothetical protein
MNKSALDKLFSMLPEGKRKQELMAKYNRVQTNTKKRGGDGLQDSFELKPKGHITIEAINDKGDVVGVLADQPNLVVDGAEEILLRSFSGDPNRILYKNRKPKSASGATGKIYISESKLNETPITDGSTILHAPNVLWAEVNEEDFDISYGFYPETLFLKEETSEEVGKKAFSLSTSSSSGRIPFGAEIYSTYTNMFIGIGEGKNYSLPLTDSRLVADEGVVKTAESITADTTGQTIEFNGKISNFTLEFEASSTGAAAEIYVNNSLAETINAEDANLTAPETVSYSMDAISSESATSLRIVHAGGQTLKVTGVYLDELQEGMNHLMGELENFETKFSTPSIFNTTPMGPFTVQIPHFPLKEGTVNFVYEGLTFSEVTTVEELHNTAFVVDHLHGVVTFNRALSGLMATYEVTGELHDKVMTSTLTARGVTVEVSEGTFESRTANVYKAALDAKEGTVRVLDHNGIEMTEAETSGLVDGTFALSADNKKEILVSRNDAAGEAITKIEVIYKSDARPGVPTNYARAVIEKPKTVNEYPWFELDKGAVRFVAEFPELKPAKNITIREMGLFDGPRVDDKIAGFRNYPVKAFSLVRVGETRKDANTGIRITWTITLLNAEGETFKGGL